MPQLAASSVVLRISSRLNRTAGHPVYMGKWKRHDVANTHEPLCEVQFVLRSGVDGSCQVQF